MTHLSIRKALGGHIKVLEHDRAGPLSTHDDSGHCYNVAVTIDINTAGGIAAYNGILETFAKSLGATVYDERSRKLIVGNVAELDDTTNE